MSDGAFLAYLALLALGGILLLVIGVGGFGQTTGARVLNGLFGVAFLGYAMYLFLIFDGGTVRIFFYAFLVPILAVVNMVKGLKAKRAAAATQPGFAPSYPQPGPAPQCGAAPGFPQPGRAPQHGAAPPGRQAPGYPPAR